MLNINLSFNSEKVKTIIDINKLQFDKCKQLFSK